MTSSDGVAWSLQTAAVAYAWQSVTFGNGLFVAVANSGTTNRVMTSSDGIIWTSQTTAADNLWKSVTFGNDLFVAVATSGTPLATNRVMTSSDAITWTLQIAATSNNWQGVTFGNGLFVAVANSGTINRVMTSSDGINWTSRISAADDAWVSVVFGNGLFVAVSSTASTAAIMTATDPSCFLKGTLILTSTNEFVKIEDLTMNDLIPTYMHGNKQIVGIRNKTLHNSSSYPLSKVFKHKECELTVTGAHSVLVDALTRKQKEQQSAIGFHQKIDDKFLLLACFSNDFVELPVDNICHDIYHLCLQNEDLHGHYGIWTNHHILTETCSINHFNNNLTN